MPLLATVRCLPAARFLGAVHQCRQLPAGVPAGRAAVPGGGQQQRGGASSTAPPAGAAVPEHTGGGHGRYGVVCYGFGTLEVCLCTGFEQYG
jgi:hypothetical protein